MNIFKKIGQKINHYFEHLAEANEKAYGHKRLDCCDMNKKSPVGEQHYTNGGNV
ncbi:MAG: LDCC motif putative metal-binding protein [Spirochaetia bacterium]|jgi:hypothetical protein